MLKTSSALIKTTTSPERLKSTRYPEVEGADTLRGNAANDTLDGGGGADSLFGGSDNDVLIGGPGRDLLHGGDNTDTIDYSGETMRLQLDLALGSARTQADNVDTIVGIEQIIGTTLDDSMRGDALSNTLDGNDGNDVIRAFGGQDTLTGGLGDDTVDGGSGQDTLDGGDGNDTITGGLDNDTITGGLGDDTITGGQGTDRLLYSGEWGNDSVVASDPDTIIELSDVPLSDINLVPTANDLAVNIAGRAATITITNYVGNEGNVRILDQDGTLVDPSVSQTLEHFRFILTHSRQQPRSSCSARD